MGHTVNMFCQTLKWLILSCSRWCLRWKVVIAMDTWWLACFQDTSDWPGWVTRHKILKSGWILQCSLFIKYISQSFQMKHVQPGIDPAGRSGYRSWMDWASPLISAKKKKSHYCGTQSEIETGGVRLTLRVMFRPPVRQCCIVHMHRENICSHYASFPGVRT